jgi:hypothetical protein
MGFLMHLLGFNCFTLGKVANRLMCAGHAANPFNISIVGNCCNFWTRWHKLGIKYDWLFEISVEGLRE